MARYQVKKCICHGKRFEEIKEYAREQGYDAIEQLKEDDFCSCQCGMCSPYIETMLKTGQTSFEPGSVLSPE